MEPLYESEPYFSTETGHYFTTYHTTQGDSSNHYGEILPFGYDRTSNYTREHMNSIYRSNIRTKETPYANGIDKNLREVYYHDLQGK